MNIQDLLSHIKDCAEPNVHDGHNVTTTLWESGSIRARNFPTAYGVRLYVGQTFATAMNSSPVNEWTDRDQMRVCGTKGITLWGMSVYTPDEFAPVEIPDDSFYMAQLTMDGDHLIKAMYYAYPDTPRG